MTRYNLLKAAAQSRSGDDIEGLHQPINWRMVLRLIKMLAPWRKNYAGVAVAGLTIAGLEMIPPRLVGNCVNLIAMGTFSMIPVLQAAAAWSSLTVACQLLHAWQIRQACFSGESALASMRQKMFDHLQRLSMSYYDRVHPGRIIARATSDIDAVRGVLAWGFNTLCANAVMMLLAAAMICRTDIRLFLAIAWLAPLMSWMQIRCGRKVALGWQEVRRHFTIQCTNQAENIAGVRVVAAFNRQDENFARYTAMQTINTANNVQVSALAGGFAPLLQGCRFTGQATLLLYGAYLVASARLQAGDVVAAALYWESFMQPAVNFGAFFNELMMAMAGAERLFSLLDEPSTNEDRPDATPLPRLTGEVTFDHVSFAYHDDQPVLKDLSFDVAAGSTVALVGCTGSGKSTIIALLARLYQPQRGRILLDGRDLAFATGASLHAQIAMVMQANHLFSGTILDNLRYGKPSASLAELHQAARQLGCHDRFLALKEGYDTHVGERGAALSLGERQLVCFTRALVADPRLLLLDEATSAVDCATEADLQLALQRLVRSRTTFIVAHRLSTIVSADKILLLDGGRIAETGTHRQLVANRGAYAGLYRHAQATG